MNHLSLAKYALIFCLFTPVLWAADIHIRVINSQGNPVKDAIVFLKSDDLLAQSTPMKNIKVAQQDIEFVPQVQIITTGTAVEFPNHDHVQHHVYSFSDAKTFELKLYSGQPQQAIIFDKEGVVELGCNIHDGMLAWILVSDSAFHAQTNKNGETLFQNQESGDYTIDVWHQSFPYGIPFETATFRVEKNDINQVMTLSVQGEAF